MPLPSVEDCVRSRGIKRELLRTFDDLLRDMLLATQLRARELNLADAEIGSACVTVIMTVAASAALATVEGLETFTDASFIVIAREALNAAKQKSRFNTELIH